MNSMLLGNWSWSLDGWIVLTGVLCACAASLLGNFLVLRRMSMLGDAISHAVLPGLAAAFLLTGSRNSLPMFIGAVAVGVLTAFFTEWIRSAGRVDESASMGVVFTSLFALGLVMIVQAADRVDLDPGCVLYGAIESTPLDQIRILGWLAPRAVWILGAVLVLNLLFVLGFFKELKLSSFDPQLATTLGFSARGLHYLLMILVAVTAVASFESVGNILVVAMMIVPPATAYLLTDRLGWMVSLSLVIAAVSATAGHVAAVYLPAMFGMGSTTTAGMMAVVAGVILAIVVIGGPRRGILVRVWQHQRLRWGILADDVVALLYRREEKSLALQPAGGEAQPGIIAPESIRETLIVEAWRLRIVLWWLKQKRLLQIGSPGVGLTRAGRLRGRQIVRAHRLWEQYLVKKAGVDSTRIHDKAERFEHFTAAEMRQRLNQATDAPDLDPHGTPIPPEKSANDTP